MINEETVIVNQTRFCCCCRIHLFSFQNRIFVMKPKEKLLKMRGNILSTLRKNFDLFSRKHNNETQEPVLLAVYKKNPELREERHFGQITQKGRWGNF